MNPRLLAQPVLSFPRRRPRDRAGNKGLTPPKRFVVYDDPVLRRIGNAAPRTPAGPGIYSRVGREQPSLPFPGITGLEAAAPERLMRGALAKIQERNPGLGRLASAG